MAESKKKKKSKEEIVINLDNAGVPIAILISGILIASVVYFASRSNTSVSPETLGDTTEPAVEEEAAYQPVAASDVATLGDGPILGDLDTATVAIVEYNEFQCGYCKRHLDETFPLIQENYIDTGKVVYVFKEFAIYGDDTANAAKCVYHLEGVDAYKEFHTGGFEVEGEEDIYALAKEVGVNEGEFDECYTSKTYQSEIDADKEEGTNVGVKGTPGFVVGRIGEDGTVEGDLIAGAYPYDTFVQAIESFLE